MNPKTHSLPFPARQASNDEKGGVELFFPSKKSQTTNMIRSSRCKIQKRQNRQKNKNKQKGISQQKYV
jgi:hypothetical protein